MACDCITVLDKALQPHNTRLASTIVFTSPGYECVTIMSEKVAKLRDGKSAVAVLPTYCPFCGVRYVPQEEVA